MFVLFKLHAINLKLVALKVVCSLRLNREMVCDKCAFIVMFNERPANMIHRPSVASIIIILVYKRTKEQQSTCSSTKTPNLIFGNVVKIAFFWHDQFVLQTLN